MPDALNSAVAVEIYEPPVLVEVGCHGDLTAGMAGNSWDGYVGLFLS